jgi:hypothetical protein
MNEERHAAIVQNRSKQNLRSETPPGLPSFFPKSITLTVTLVDRDEPIEFIIGNCGDCDALHNEAQENIELESVDAHDE